MGLYESIAKVYEEIQTASKKSGFTLSMPQQRALVNAILTQMVNSEFNEADFRRIVEREPRPDIDNPRPMRSFTAQEREVRRERSHAIREAIYDHLFDDKARLTPYTTNGQAFDRADQRMFRIPPENPSSEDLHRVYELNEEASRLFDANKQNLAAYEEECARVYTTIGKVGKDGVRQLLTHDEALEAVRSEQARRRAEMVLERIREAGAIFDNIENLFSPDATLEQLKENAQKIMEASHVYGEIQNWLCNSNLGRDKDGNPEKAPRIAFTPEEIRWMRSEDKKQAQFSVALDKLRMIANPSYELVDIDVLDDYDDSEYMFNDDNPNAFEYQEDHRGTRVNKINRTFDKILGPYIKEDPNDKVSNFCKLLKVEILKTSSTMTLLINDQMFKEGNRKEAAKDTVSDTRAAYCFSGDENYYIEKTDKNDVTYLGMDYDVEDFGFGAPIAFEKNGRVVIFTTDFSRTSIDPTVKTNPEELYNNKLDKKLQGLVDRLADADPWYRKGSPQFTAIRDVLDAIKGNLKLASGGDIGTIARRLDRLKRVTQNYLEGKNEEGKNDYEQERIDTAKSILEFVNVKMKELDLVGKARVTLNRFAGKTEEEIHQICAAEDVAISHSEHAYPWMKGLYNEYVDRSNQDRNRIGRGLPETIITQMKDTMFDLEVLEANGAYYPKSPQTQMTIINTFAQTCGAMIAAEMVFRERANGISDDAGPIERLFAGEEGKRQILELGKQAMTVLTAAPYPDMTAAELKNFLGVFEPKDAADRLTKLFVRQTGLDFMDKIARQYPLNAEGREAAPETAFQRFNREEIQESALQYTKQMAGGAKTVGQDAVRVFLGNCIMANMVYLEQLGNGGAPGKLEQLFGSEEKIDVLRGVVEKSDFFKNMMKDDVIRGKDEIGIQVLPQLVDNNTVQLVAKNILLESFSKHMEPQKPDKAAQKEARKAVNQAQANNNPPQAGAAAPQHAL